MRNVLIFFFNFKAFFLVCVKYSHIKPCTNLHDHINLVLTYMICAPKRSPIFDKSCKNEKEMNLPFSRQTDAQGKMNACGSFVTEHFFL